MSASANVPLATIVAALRDAGLLASEPAVAPGEITGITDDSRNVVSGGCFIAVRGTIQDGHDYIARARADGASVVIAEDAVRAAASSSGSSPVIIVRNGRRAAAVAAAAFYGHPARALRLVAVTGTNGKTTTVGMLRHVLDAPAPHRAASIGTLGVLIGSTGTPVEGGGGLTTPGPVELQRVLRVLVDAGVATVAMEVSSHSLAQQRVEGIEFDVAVFTNLTRDHLDYHGTMEAYFAAKAALVRHLKADGAAVVNVDDDAWAALPATPRRLSFGGGDGADVRARYIRYETQGSRFRLITPQGAAEVSLPLIGDFNVTNAIGAAGAAHALGMASPLIAMRLSSMPQVPGRLERIGERPTVLRDYAHTPDALERALTTLRASVQGRLIVVFGAGGDRDPGKRPLMGEIAARLADVAIITSDNPRTEDPERIIDGIAAGMSGRDYERIEDRRAAIARAIAVADPEKDLVLLAGKGHETYQVRGTTKLPFDERQIVAELLAPAARAAFWTLSRVTDALGQGTGATRGTAAQLPRGDAPFTRIWTDTRTIQPGDLFVALRGEQFDAHDFLADAVRAGATGVVVTEAKRCAGLGVPVFEVSDTLHALGSLATYRRLAWGRPVIAVGGSNGKTSTKELIRAALGARLDVHATQGNLNNQVGVPQTLLALDDFADVAVIEVGTNVPGEIAILREIVRPDVAVVTAIEEEHLEGFGDLAGVLREEASLLDGVALAIVPAAEAELVTEARKRAGRVVTAGIGGGELSADSGRLADDGTGRISIGGVEVSVPLRGAHNMRNALLAIAVARACGLSIEDAARGIAALDPAAMPGMRSAVEPLGDAMLINDAYNANPGSARAALALLAAVSGSRPRVVVLGTMRELGSQAARAHAEIAAEALASGATLVAGIGEFAAALRAAGAGDRRVIAAADVDDLWPALESRLPANAAILLKASRGVKLERIVPLLREWASGEATATSPYRTD